MAIKEAYVTDLRKVILDGKAMRGIFEGKEVLRMIYGGEIVFNRALYHLDVPTELSVEASGGTWDSLLTSAIASYKTDRDGEQTHIEVLLPDGEGISPNTEEEERTGTYKVRQQKSGLSISGTWTQEKKRILHYSVRQVWSVSPDYEEVEAKGGNAAPSVSVTLWMNVHWSDESVTTEYKTYFGSVTSASGKVVIENVVGSQSTIDSSTGIVAVPSLDKSERDARDVFTVETLAGTVYVPDVNGEKTFEWIWSGAVQVKQKENKKNAYGTPDYTLKSSVDKTELNAVDTNIKVTGTAIKTSYYYYDSAPDDIKSSISNETLYVLLDENISDARQLKGTDDSATFTVGINTSTENDRTFKVHVYNTSLGYDKTHMVTQKKNSMTTYWTTPVLNGAIVIENILANGSGFYISVPVKQQKYGQVEGVATDTLLETFTGSVFATDVGGTAVDGTGATFKDGMMSANSMGTTIYPSGRTVYKLSSVKVTGKDGASYTLPLPEIIEIKQNKNERYTAYGAYVLSVSANPTTGIANTGGTSKILATAQQNITYTWDSGATPVDDKINVKGTLTTTVGTLSADSVTGSGSSTLTFGENIADERTATITLTVGENKKTCTVSQNAVSYVLTKGEDKECNATASTINVSFTSSRNGSAWQPAFTANLSGVTFGTISRSGTTYTVPVNIPENKEQTTRTIIITATQTRYDGSKTTQVTITQADAAADNRPKAAFVYVFQYTDASKSNVDYSVYFDASQKKNGEYVYKGGKFTNVVIQLNTQENGGGSVLGNSAELGDVTVSQGGKSETYSGTIKAGQSCYVRVYYDNTWQLVTPPDEYIQEE